MQNHQRKVLPFKSAPERGPETGEENSEFPRRVLLADWHAERAARIAELVSEHLSSVEFKQVDNLVNLVPVCGKSNPDVILTSLEWPQKQESQTLENQQAGVEVLLALRLLGFVGEAVVFQDGASRLPIEEYCRPFALGASHFLDSGSPHFFEELQEKLNECLQRSARRRDWEHVENDSARQLVESMGIVGRSSAMLDIFGQVQRAARVSDVTVLITGESGTGKQRLAEAIHRLDMRRKDSPFVTVNCATIPHDLAETELFGHKRGAFTGAATERTGYFRMANGGTILLDEIGDLPLSLQPKLLRVLQEKKVSPVGADQETTVDVRVIAATNRNLEALVEAEKFRLDLYQRLSAFRIEVPPLRVRKDDLLLLISFFINKYKRFCSCNVEGVDPRVIEILSTLDLPGNVRQLENLVLQILSEKESGNIIEIRDLPENMIRKVAVGSSDETEGEISKLLMKKVLDQGMSLSEALEYCEQLLLRVALYRTRGNRTQTAEMLKVTSRTVFNKIHKYHLKISGSTSPAIPLK